MDLEKEDAVANDISSLSSSTLDDRSCPECEGNLWDDGGEVVCGDCSIVVEKVPSPRTLRTEWDHFFDQRPEHWNSERPRCIGGFPWVYDWVSSDDTDGSVADVDPDVFYK